MADVSLMADVLSLDRELQAIKKIPADRADLEEARNRWFEHYQAVFDRDDLDPQSRQLKRVNDLYDQFYRHFQELDVRSSSEDKTESTE